MRVKDVDAPRTNLFIYRGLIVVVVALLLFCAAGALYLFTGIFHAPEPPRKTEGALVHRDTGEETDYSLEILMSGEIENERIRRWIDDKTELGIIGGKPVYYALYQDNPYALMDMYLYMPLAQDIMGDIGLSNISVSESGMALVLDIQTNDNISRTIDGTDLILHIFAEYQDSGEANVLTERLFVNGTRYYCPGTTFIQLGVRSEE